MEHVNMSDENSTSLPDESTSIPEQTTTPEQTAYTPTESAQETHHEHSASVDDALNAESSDMTSEEQAAIEPAADAVANEPGANEPLREARKEKPQGNRPQAARPQGRPSGKPQGGRPGGKPQGGRPQGGKSFGAPKQRREIKRFVVVAFSSEREPADSMFWCEAERNGEWLNFVALDQVRTRREILERLTELDEGLVALDFPFSFPRDFMDQLAPEGMISWRQMIHQVREDLKKNAEDGVRKWVDRIGRYRESKLEDASEFRRPERRPDRRDFNRGRNDRFNDRQSNQAPEPYELRSLAERFRRTEHAIRRAAEKHLTSAVQIGYNRLTSRYEFNDLEQRGKSALFGMSMLDQLLDAKPEVAVWPFERAKKLTIVEVHPWLFLKGKDLEPAQMREWVSREEDSGIDVPSNVRELASRNVDAQRAFRTLLGIFRAETRQDRAIRPVRDYQESFYEDKRLALEGWLYGVGYRAEDAPPKEKVQREKREAKDKRRGPRPAQAEAASDIDTSFAKDLESAAVIPQIPETDNPVMAEVAEVSAPTGEETVANEQRDE